MMRVKLQSWLPALTRGDKARPPQSSLSAESHPGAPDFPRKLLHMAHLDSSLGLKESVLRPTNSNQAELQGRTQCLLILTGADGV